MNQNLYQSFYTKSSVITKYMVNKLDLKSGDSLFEPCAGDGAFLDEIIDRELNVNITAFELNPKAYNLLLKKYETSNVDIYNEDTILYDTNSIFNKIELDWFDKIIANPPYGAWQDYSKRLLLKKMYPNMYIKETYGLFLYKCVDLLKEGGKLSFIIPDTFLSLHNHKELRKSILTKTRIEEIVKFPSSFFPGINFSYAGLSIITLTKDKNLNNCLSNEINIKTGYKEINDLLSNNYLYSYKFYQKDILTNSSYAFYLTDDKNILSILSNSITIGDIADCVTGIYSGNDKKYLRVSTQKKIKGSDKFLSITDKFVCYDKNKFNLEGLTTDNYFIPLQKSNGRTAFNSKPNWFIDWNTEAVKEYNSDKKARFQNKNYYFRDGIAIPMVKTSKTLAFKLDGYLFDQSIVGVFPKNHNDLFYLLAFFNSTFFKKLINTINPSANNSANYIKKTPLPILTDLDKEIVTKLSKDVYDLLEEQNDKRNEILLMIEDIFNKYAN